MIRRLYATLWHLAPFLIRRHLRRRALKSPAYLEHWGERFGQAYPNPVQRPIWIHAVSVGENACGRTFGAGIVPSFFPTHRF